MLVAPHHLFDWKVERDSPVSLQRFWRLLESSLPVQRLEPEKPIIGAVGERRQSGGRALTVREENEPLSGLGNEGQVRREPVDGPVVNHQGMATVAFVNPAQGVVTLLYLKLI